MSLDKFGDFLLESVLNESVLYFSPVFREKLQNVDNKISKALLDLEGTDVSSDITFIDVTKNEPGKVTFMPMNQAISKLKSVYPEAKDTDLQNKPNVKINDLLYDRELGHSYSSSSRYTGLYSPDRNSVKLGKLVKKVFSGQQSSIIQQKLRKDYLQISQTPSVRNRDCIFSDAEIEEFVNQFKSASDKFNLEIKLVSGKEISKYYKAESYEEMKGSLSSSCMNDKDFFELYEENPDVCQLAIVLRGDKIVSRALVWKVESDNPEIKYYMDRVYVTKEHYNNILNDWADEQGWARWGRGSVVFRGKEMLPDMKVKVKKKEYEKYPFLDTFRRYDYVKGYLYNDSRTSKRGDILTSTHGHKNRNDRTRLQRFGDYFGIGENINN